MTRLEDLPADAAEHAMEHGEFPQSILNATSQVAVIMTQGWCPDWQMMKMWVSSAETKDSDAQVDLTVYTLVYDRVDFFDRFRRFKEGVFGNFEIPYVRYYRDGELVGQSNAVMRKQFYRILGG